MKSSSTKKLSTRKAKHTDIPLLNHIYYRSKGYWGYSKKYLDKYLKEYQLDPEYLDDNVVYVLLLNKKIIGYYGFYFDEDDTIELDHFFLLPEYIGKGYGRALWNYACKTAKKYHKKEFYLWVEPDAEPFYKKMGCEVIGMKSTHLLTDEPSAVMRYRLPRKRVL